MKYRGYYIVKTSKYIGSGKQIYSFQDLKEYFRAFGFVETVKQILKDCKSSTPYFKI